MSDRIKTRHTGKAVALTNPITGCFAITPSDTVDLQEVPISIYVGTPGSLKATMYDGSTVTYPAIAVGRHNLRVKRVWAAGTTAAGLIAEC